MKYLAFNYPKTISELLEIFYEAKEIVPQKIFEYKQERSNVVTKLKDFNTSVKHIARLKNKDEFFVWFWGYSYLKYLYAPRIVEIDKHLQRLYRQNLFLNNQGKSYQYNFTKLEDQKIQAESQPLSDIALPYLENVRYTSNRITSRCPFHDEKTPSFVIYLNQNTYHCFGCQAHGNVITFVMQKENLSFLEAIRRLSA